MKKIILNSLLISGLILSSCEQYTDGLNEDPNNFTDVPGELVIGQTQLTLVATSESQPGRYAGLFTDQFSGCDRQYVGYESYTMITGDFDDAWDDIYADGIGQAQFVKEKATEEGNSILLGVAQIMEAALAGEATALWGDVPFSQVGQPTEFPNPVYDAQTDVLNAVQDLLTQAIANVGNATVAVNYGTPVFMGNDATWAEIAHSLKARYFLIAKNYESALTEAQQGISSAAGDLLASHGTANGAKNMYYQFIVEQRGGYMGICNNPYLVQLLDGTVPRLLATPGDADRLNVYFDVANSELNTNAGGYFALDASFPIVSWVETKLVEAEAAARTGGDGQTPFNEVRDYLATVYTGAFPQTTATGNALINEILEEKYISLIGSLQVFHDMRRTNNALGITNKGPNALLPQRFLYPQVEVNANDNFPGVQELFVPTQVNQ